MAFVTTGDVLSIFESASKYIIDKYDDLLNDFIQYLQKNYVGMTIGRKIKGS